MKKTDFYVLGKIIKPMELRAQNYFHETKNGRSFKPRASEAKYFKNISTQVIFIICVARFDGMEGNPVLLKL